jgi:hypothetical protein
LTLIKNGHERPMKTIPGNTSDSKRPLGDGHINESSHRASPHTSETRESLASLKQSTDETIVDVLLFHLLN